MDRTLFSYFTTQSFCMSNASFCNTSIFKRLPNIDTYSTICQNSPFLDCCLERKAVILFLQCQSFLNHSSNKLVSKTVTFYPMWPVSVNVASSTSGTVFMNMIGYDMLAFCLGTCRGFSCFARCLTLSLSNYYPLECISIGCTGPVWSLNVYHYV